MSLLIKEKKLKSLTPNNKLLLLRDSVSHFILKLWLWDREGVGRGELVMKSRNEKEHD